MEYKETVDFNLISSLEWTHPIELYIVDELKNKILCCRAYNDKKNLTHVLFAPRIDTENSTVYSKVINYEKILTTVQNNSDVIYCDKTLMYKDHIFNDIHDSKFYNELLNCYKFLCISYYRNFNTFLPINKSSILYLFKISNTPKHIHIDSLYYNSLACCAKITNVNTATKLNNTDLIISNLVNDNVSPSFPLLYYETSLDNNEYLYIMEQIGPTVPVFFIYAPKYIPFTVEMVDKILFEFIYGLLCINIKLHRYHGDLHLNNMTIFSSRNKKKNIIYSIASVDNVKKTFLFKDCLYNAGIIDIEPYLISIYYFNKAFNQTIHKNTYDNNTIILLSSLADTYYLLNNIRSYLLQIHTSSNNTVNLFISRITKLLSNVIQLSMDINTLIEKRIWPNYIILCTSFKKYINTECDVSDYILASDLHTSC